MTQNVVITLDGAVRDVEAAGGRALAVPTDGDGGKDHGAAAAGVGALVAGASWLRRR